MEDAPDDLEACTCPHVFQAHSQEAPHPCLGDVPVETTRGHTNYFRTTTFRTEACPCEGFVRRYTPAVLAELSDEDFVPAERPAREDEPLSIGPGPLSIDPGPPSYVPEPGTTELGTPAEGTPELGGAACGDSSTSIETEKHAQGPEVLDFPPQAEIAKAAAALCPCGKPARHVGRCRLFREHDAEPAVDRTTRKLAQVRKFSGLPSSCRCGKPLRHRGRCPKPRADTPLPATPTKASAAVTPLPRSDLWARVAPLMDEILRTGELAVLQVVVGILRSEGKPLSEEEIGRRVAFLEREVWRAAVMLGLFAEFVAGNLDIDFGASLKVDDVMWRATSCQPRESGT